MAVFYSRCLRNLYFKFYTTSNCKKGIAVQKLINFLEKEGTQNELIALNNDYNEVSNIFAPYQRTNSSRGKYLDSQLRKNNLEKLIKKYDK